MFPRGDILLAQAQTGGGLVALLPLVLVLVIFYLLLILPAQRRQKKIATMQRTLKTGDKIITNGGIYGVVAGMDDESVQVRVADQVKLRVARSAVASLQAEGTKEG
jgi:preprotein translocase subunit YajC